MDNNKIQNKYQIIKSSLDSLSFNDEGELYLLVIGINSYQKEPNLKYCKNEANDFIEIFYENNNLKRKNIYSIFDFNATKINILTHINDFKNILNEEDKLIIYFAGHGYNTEYSNFFIPHDGSKDNFTSCIPNSLIAKSLTEIRSNSILLFYDLKFSSSEFENYKIKSDLSYLHAVRNEISHESSENSSYSKFIDFFSKNSKNRVKEAFCFMKEDFEYNNEQIHYFNWDFENKLKNVLTEKYSDLVNLIKEHKTEQVLSKLTDILENNDADLLSRVQSLQYKLNEIENIATRTISREQKEDIDVINQVTCEVIERISQNGFYLIKTPKDLSEINLKEKPRIKILFTSANPRDENFLRLNQEARLIEYELMKAKFRDNFEFIKIKAIDINELQDALLNQSPQFLHFSGHGNCDGLTLLNDNDEAQLVKTKPLADLFKLFSNEIQCIFLNSCHSAGQSHEISKHIKKIICPKLAKQSLKLLNL
ncbi:caspase family protein [Chryseobacterium sp.]|uniref:caspase family protein n=1 Tax=Chryseobacterium sp. TaxID=1871047 RepID=UPI002FC6E45B